MRIPKALQTAINTYYAFSGRSRLRDNVPANWKIVCLEAIDRVCHRHGIGLVAAAGTFFLVKGQQKAQISPPCLPNRSEP